MWPVLLPYLTLVGVHALFDCKDAAGKTKTLRDAFLRCLPMAYLALVLTSTGAIHKQHGRRIYFVLLAACLSAASDLCLAFHSLLLPGLLAMCAARISCTAAFGFGEPLRCDIGIMFLLGMIVLLLFFLPTVKSIPVCVGIVCYAVLLSALSWRSVAACYLGDHEVAPLIACAGALLVVCSDVGSAFRTCGYTGQGVVPCFVLVAYYTGQALLALSVLIPSWERMQFGGVL